MYVCDWALIIPRRKPKAGNAAMHMSRAPVRKLVDRNKETKET